MGPGFEKSVVYDTLVVWARPEGFRTKRWGSRAGWARGPSYSYADETGSGKSFRSSLVHSSNGQGAHPFLYQGLNFQSPPPHIGFSIPGGGTAGVGVCRVLGVFPDPNPLFIILPSTVTSSHASENMSSSMPSWAS